MSYEEGNLDPYPPKKKCRTCGKPLSMCNPKSECFACQQKGTEAAREDRAAQMKPRGNSIPSARMDKPARQRTKEERFEAKLAAFRVNGGLV